MSLILCGFLDQQWGNEPPLNYIRWVPLKMCEFCDLGSVNIGSLLRSDGMSNQWPCVCLWIYRIFPKWLIFMGAIVMLEIEIWMK